MKASSHEAAGENTPSESTLYRSIGRRVHRLSEQASCGHTEHSHTVQNELCLKARSHVAAGKNTPSEST
jgi:hypothetical protein